MKNRILLIVDPQNDFVVADDGHGHQGTLVVPGAVEDMNRVTDLVIRATRSKNLLGGVAVTADTHQGIGIERPGWWVYAKDRSLVQPFTVLGPFPDGSMAVVYDSNGQPTDREVVTAIPSLLHKGGVTGQGSLGYLKALQKRGRSHMVWPTHCVLGTWGFGVYEPLARALTDWEIQSMDRITWVLKGTDPETEQFSAIKAEVENPKNPNTHANVPFVNYLLRFDEIIIAGEARSHCVDDTVTDIANLFGNDLLVQKMVFLVDGSSDVSGFSEKGEKFMRDLKARGMRTAKSTEVL